MKILDYMKENLVFLDGGMGTLLQASGMKAGELPERRSLTHADEITAIHRAYFDAGANVVNTNTFGANTLKFSDEELEEIVRASVACARRAAEESPTVHAKFVALDIGPSGRMLAPYGDFDFEEAVALFAKTVKLGVKCGVDLIFIETMNDTYEVKAALLAAKENSDLPVFVSCAYGEDGKLMTGADPSAVIAMLEGLGADAVGVNCSLGPKALAPVVRAYLEEASVPVILKPNAGLPKAENGRTVYDVSPEGFADDVSDLIRAGVRIAGGCCGTTPDYIRALTKKSTSIAPVPVQEKNVCRVSSYTHAVSFGASPILIGERINPTGKKRFKEALKNHDIDYILKEGIAQEEKGVHILDVNVGLPEIDEPSMLEETVCALQAVTALPLQIDTSDAIAMERALRRYNGKPMINSVNGKRESMESVFPLAKKYGGVVVALTLDEKGIPETAEERCAIACRIIECAASYGIARKDLIFDPLALTVSADNHAAEQTLRALSIIKNQLGCPTSLGVSNVSFGLPSRDAINGTFFALALANGLSAAIMNPYSFEMMKTYFAYRALAGLDANCADYIAFSEIAPTVNAPSAVPTQNVALGDYASQLQRAIAKGLKEEASSLTRALLAEKQPLVIISEEIVPALDLVGAGFEKKTVFLPQLLMSAEAASAAFEVIKGQIQDGRAAVRSKIVLATVKGDIHDIGKNIVKLLLENYGFAVTDLGRDVPPERILEETLRLHAPIVGLSALMTTTVPEMEKTVRLLRKNAPFAKIMVGGAVLTAEYAEKIGADRYAKDAMGAVRVAEELEKM